jgi:copper homeostasis protein (lipoprotein)
MFAVSMLSAGACHRSPPPQAIPAQTNATAPIQTAAPSRAQPLPQELPALYAGLLPCADCEGIRYELDLRRDQVFFSRMTYLGKPAPNTLDQIGRWNLGEDHVLTLTRGEGTPVLWSMRDVSSLHKLDGHSQAIASQHDFILARQAQYRALEPSLEMRGMYQRHAEGAVFEECQTGLKLALTPQSNQAALDKAYANARGTSDEPALITLQGHIVQSQTDAGAASEMLIVESFKEISPNERCGASGVIHELEGTRWALTRLNEEATRIESNQREPFIVLEPTEHRISGFGGCNRIVGRYEQNGQTIHFTELAMTRMACPSMKTEDSVQRALTSAATWSIDGAQLKLLDADGNIVARFEARNL